MANSKAEQVIMPAMHGNGALVGVGAVALIAALLAGCVADQPIAALSFEVTSATVREGDCTFGARDDASDPEWCHVLQVAVENRDRADTADVSRTSWEADDDRGGRHTLPGVQPDDAIPPGGTAILELRFAAGPDTRLSTLRHVGTFGGSTEGPIPDYGA